MMKKITKNIMQISVCLSLLFVTAVKAQEFRTVEHENMLVMETTEGQVLIELAPQFAPNHVARIKELVRKSAYNNMSFYRVIEGFVAQGGLSDESDLKVPEIKIEAEFSTKGKNIAWVQENDLFAKATGFIDGFPFATNQQDNIGWLTHCPGMVALARGNEADTGTSDFYIVIGQAPRYLDNIMTVFGRVLVGMDVVQSINRGPSSANGIIEDKAQRTLINSISVAADLPADKRPKVEVELTSGKSFAEKLDSRKNRTHAFFFKKPPPVLDVCQVPLSVKVS